MEQLQSLFNISEYFTSLVQMNTGNKYPMLQLQSNKTTPIKRNANCQSNARTADCCKESARKKTHDRTDSKWNKKLERKKLK